MDKIDIAFFWSKVEIPYDPIACWIWKEGTDKNGYGQFSLKGKRKAHRLAYEFFCGKIPDGLCVCHTCDNPSCVNPKHLFTGTHRDNMLDMIRKNRSGLVGLKGEQCPSSKLKNEDVLRIRQLRKEGKTYQNIADTLGVSWSIVRDVLCGRTWKHIK